MLAQERPVVMLLIENRTNFAKPCAFESQSLVLRVSIPLAHHLLTLCLDEGLVVGRALQYDDEDISMKTARIRLLLAKLLCVLLLTAPCSNRAADTFIQFNDFWLYLDTGVDQGTAWQQPVFDDSSWSVGIAQFGFGEGDEFFVLNSAPNGSPLNTAYFRTVFGIADAGTYSNLTVRVLRDDGAIVYINGIEVFRSNMPTGAVNYATRARRNIDGADEFVLAQRVVPAQVLVSGQNVLAVEVHQADGGFDDMSFDFQLIGHRVDENQPPSAYSTFVSVEQDRSTNITLNATDPDNNPLTYTLLTSPQNGSLTGTAPNLTYTPNTGYTGPDMFSFKASDGQWETEIAYVCIDVTPVSNHPPVADSQNVTVAEDTSLNITLTASDPDGDVLTYVYTQPSHGTLSPGAGQTVVYQPALNYNGPDAFTFSVDDGRGGVANATVNITVTPVNDAPVADAQNVLTSEDTPLAITLTANDIENDSLSFAYSQPAHGVITGNGSSISYSPTPNFHGTDSFTFTVDDGNGGTGSATVNIIVAPVNDSPVAVAKGAPLANPTAFTDHLELLAINSQSASVIFNGADSSDIDGDSLTYAWFLNANTTPFSLAANGTTSVPIGSHTLTLVVSDGVAMVSDSITVDVFTPCDLVKRLAACVQATPLKPNEMNALLSRLDSACSAFESGNINNAVHHLELFQDRVSKKVDPPAAQKLIDQAQQIIDQVSGQSVNTLRLRRRR